MISLATNNGPECIMNALKQAQASFTNVVTNYTNIIEYAGRKEKFVKSMRGKKCFAAFAKIKADVSKHSVPEVEEDGLKYFHNDIKKSLSCNEAYQIDITKAYATALKNSGYITNDTFLYLDGLKKEDRLASVGMLASVRNEFDYRGDEIVDHRIVESPYQNFFFFSVERIYEVMTACRLSCYEDYLFTWVDAIYIRSNKKALRKIVNLLYYNGYECKVQPLQSISCKINGRTISVGICDESGLKKFNMPIPCENKNRTNIDYWAKKINRA